MAAKQSEARRPRRGPEPGAAAAAVLQSPDQTAPRGKRRVAAEGAPEPLPRSDIEQALQEIATVPAATLHRTAARSWAARAVACYRVCLGKSDLQEGLSYFCLGEHYREAALAHASLGEAWGPMYEAVDLLMEGERVPAAATLQSRAKTQPLGEAGGAARARP